MVAPFEANDEFCKGQEGGDEMSETRSVPFRVSPSYKQLRTSKVVQIYRREWFQKIREKAKQGIPFGICNVDECEEIFTAFGMPVVTVQWWAGIIAAKRLSEYYFNKMSEKGYDMDHYNSLGLACTMDNNPEIAPYGGLPKPAIIIGSTELDQALTIKEIWAREYGCPCFPLEAGGYVISPTLWWEKIRDHWDELIDPKLLDFRVEQYKELIRFIEITTGLRFSLVKLNEVMELVNEQEDYWRKARDLIAITVPCPVTLPDQLVIYGAQWYRGTTEGRDHIKMFYEEVKERVEQSEAAYPGEKIRLMWLSAGLWSNTDFYHYFEEKYGATFVASVYTSTAADGYARTILNNDPLRALAGRNIMMRGSTTDWLVKEAKAHKCDGAVGQSAGNGTRLSSNGLAFEKAGIPTVEIPGNNVDSRTWDDAKSRNIVSNFIETRILPNKHI